MFAADNVEMDLLLVLTTLRSVVQSVSQGFKERGSAFASTFFSGIQYHIAPGVPYCVILYCEMSIMLCRVNGNLNLSRAIGDLKYKGNAQLAPAEQIITAQPDIVKVCPCLPM